MINSQRQSWFGDRRVATVLVLVVTVCAALSVGAGSARAGQWMQISCVNPDGSSSNNDGWSQQSNPGFGSGSNVQPSCSAGVPMSANLLGTSASNSAEKLVYAPPAGSTIAGGSLTVTLVGAYGQNGGGGDAVVLAPQENFNSDQLAACDFALAPGSGAPTPCGPETQTLGLPAGGGIYVDAICGGGVNPCPPDAGNRVAIAQVDSADILLANNAVPAGTGFTGTALGTVSGNGNLLFTASDPNGPGVYSVAVAIDGQTVYSATPNSNNGACVAVGTDQASGALEFDSSTPCPGSASVNAPISFTGVANGTHTLTATVTDAAQNTATVLDQTITVANPVATTPTTPTTPITPTSPAPPKALRKIDDKLIAGWDYRNRRTRLESIRFARKAKLPKTGRITYGCAPAARTRCPRLALAHQGVEVKQVARLFAALKRLRFAKGDVVQLSITAPHRKAERVVFRIHLHRVPTARIYYGKSRLPARKRSESTS